MKLISTRIEKKQEEYLKKLARLIKTDKSYELRRLLEKGIQVDKKEKALDFYIKGTFSLGKAAHFAEMTVGEFFEYMREKGIESNLTMEDFKESLQKYK